MPSSFLHITASCPEGAENRPANRGMFCMFQRVNSLCRRLTMLTLLLAVFSLREAYAGGVPRGGRGDRPPVTKNFK